VHFHGRPQFGRAPPHPYAESSEAKSTILAVLALPGREYAGAPLKKGVSGVKKEQRPDVCFFLFMSSIDPISGTSSGLAKATLKRARAAQKPRPASGLGESRAEQSKPQHDLSPEPEDQGLHHSGTMTDVPFRNVEPDTYFTPAFITQLLGQLLPDPEEKRSGALSAYKDLYARIKLCDRLL
jgi:hypothetical protein